MPELDLLPLDLEYQPRLPGLGVPGFTLLPQRQRGIAVLLGFTLCIRGAARCLVGCRAALHLFHLGLCELLAAGVESGQPLPQLLLALLQALCCVRRLDLFVAQRPPPGSELRRLPRQLALLLANRPRAFFKFAPLLG